MAKIVTAGNITYSDALRMLVVYGGSITRLHWQSKEYQKDDVHAGTQQHIVAITARELELPDDTRLSGSSEESPVIHALVRVMVRDSFAVTQNWEPSLTDLLAQDWQWHAPRRNA